MSDLETISQAIGRIEGILTTRMAEHDKTHAVLNKRLGLNGEARPYVQGAKVGGAMAVLVTVVEVIKAVVL